MTSDIKKFLKQLDKAEEKFKIKALSTICEQIKEDTPVDTGNLKSGFKVNESSQKIENNIDYAWDVEKKVGMARLNLLKSEGKYKIIFTRNKK